MRLIREFEELFKFGGGGVVKEFCSAIKRGSPQMRRDSDNQNVFSRFRAFEVLRNGQIIIFQSELWKILNFGQKFWIV